MSGGRVVLQTAGRFLKFPFHVLLQPFDDALVQAGDIGLRNTDEIGHFLLGTLWLPMKPEPQLHNLLFSAV